MPTNDKISPRQFIAIAFVGLLSPVVRRIPRSLIMSSGSEAWLAPLMALPLCLGLVWLAGYLVRSGKGLGQLLEDSFGKVLGRILGGIVALWLVFYCGFLLRSGADRFVSTVYSDSAPWIFIIGMALLCLAAIVGSFSAIARWAMLFRPILLAVLVAVLLFGLTNCDFRGVLSVDSADLLPAAKSSLTVANTFALWFYLLFATGKVEGRLRFGPAAVWTAALIGIVEIMCLACLGVFGTELTLKLNYPFFMLVRDVSIFDSIARMETLIIAVWTFADLVLLSMLLSLAVEQLRRSLGLGGKKSLVSLLAVIAAAALGLALAPDMLSLGRLSEKLVPMGNAAVIFGLLPLLLVVGKLRKKI